MYCYNCGKEIKDNDAFCSGCGAKVAGGNDTNVNNNTGEMPVQMSVPSLKGIDMAVVKKLAVKITFLVIAIVTFFLSKEGLFVIQTDDYWGFNYYKEVGVSEVVDYIEDIVEKVSTISSEFEDAKLTVLRAAKWCVIIGAVLYLVAAVVAFLEIEVLSHLLTSLSGILHIIFVVFSVIIFKITFKLESIFDVTDFFSDLMWWYLALNAILFIISRMFFWKDE